VCLGHSGSNCGIWPSILQKPATGRIPLASFLVSRRRRRRAEAKMNSYARTELRRRCSSR
jgi:hypothetical protein